jgi:hypothetical protein
MSESRDPATSGTAAPARASYQRTSGGLVGAMLVTVVVVIGFVAVRGITNDPGSTPVQSVDYQLTVHAARAAKQLMVPAPTQLPAGWKATSVSYTDGPSPTWHLGMLTKGRKYIGIEEARTSTAKLAEEHVDPDADRGKDVTVDGQTWETWTDRGGDYAVARSLRAGGRTTESWLVVGTAPASQIRDFAGTLAYGPAHASRPAG